MIGFAPWRMVVRLGRLKASRFSHRCDPSFARLSELAGSTTPRRHFFPGAQEGGQDGPIVRVVPDRADAWIGTFGFGKFGIGITRILSMPNAGMLCVIAQGAGYVVAAHKPDTWEEVSAVPIIDARAIPTASVVVFANYTELRRKRHEVANEAACLGRTTFAAKAS
jgi:hypothetical protein